MAMGMLAGLACAGSSVAAGVLKLSRVELTLEPGRPPGELYVENVGDTPLYLDVEQHLLTNPGEAPERRVPIAEVARPSLLVLPGRLSLAPGQRYRMVLKELSVPSRPQVWRVTFRPNERVRVEGGERKGAAAPLFVKIGYGVVIYQRATGKE
ncbi:hypothetical protein P350_22815 [Burkholderia cepacia JBK9]|nr:hypothetical protein [Burkholderia arboris]ALX14383.1 hypothetical protein P350_22815 [Burkholderia cepacia JBK9]MCA8490393.1 hypothetical protein [Burkholderia arboris]UTV59658.1 hypothetical protein NLX30_21335 [Burkholderia arboris]